MTLSRAQRITVFGLVGAGHFLSHIYILALPPLFALMKAELALSYAALGLLVTVFHISTGSMQIPAGFLVDRIGARTTLLLGMFTVAIAIGAIGLVESYWAMLVLVAIAGVGNSVFHPADYAILSRVVDKKHFGKTFGFHLLAGNLGFAVAPILMVSLAHWFEWRGAVVAVGGLGVALGVCMLIFGQHLAQPAREDSDEPGKPAVSRTFMSPALVVMLVFFITVALSTAGIQTFSVTILNLHHGVELGVSNTLLTTFLATGFVGVALGGVVADRLRRPVIVVAGNMLVATVGVAFLGMTSWSVAFIFLWMAIAGTAVGMMRPARDMMVVAIVPSSATGKAFGFVGTGLSVGGAIAPITFGWMIDLGLGGWVFPAAAVCLLAGAFCAIFAERMTQQGKVAPGPAT